MRKWKQRDEMMKNLIIQQEACQGSCLPALTGEQHYKITNRIEKLLDGVEWVRGSI